MTLYQTLRKALTGSEKDDNISKSWSPNSVRAIVITRSVIIIAFYDKPPKQVHLNIGESTQEIAKNGSNGSLQNVLSKRQLSCLEEIYVDGVFKNYQGTLNLGIYVDSLVSSSSRLRYFGYIDDLSSQEFYESYSNAKLNAYKDYTYAADPNRRGTVEVHSAENDTWFKKYNLRPNEYSSDKEGGTLHAWFRSVENAMQSKYDAMREQVEGDARISALTTMFVGNYLSAKPIRMLNMLVNVLNKRGTSNGVDTSVRTALTSNSLSCTNKIYKEDLTRVLQNRKMSPSDQDTAFFLGLMKKHGAISDSKMLLSPDEILEKAKNGEEFVNAKAYMRKVVRSLGEIKSSSSQLVLLTEAHNMAGIVCNDVGTVVNWLLEKIEEGNTSIVAEYLIYVSGYTLDSLQRYYKEAM